MDENTKKLVIIIPVYNEELVLEKNMLELMGILSSDGIEAQLMLVDDGSKDSTWFVVEALARKYPMINGIKFARNFGKEIALNAGLHSIDASMYLFMDSDLQHPPKYIKEMLQIMEDEDADIVEGVKSSRGKESLKYRLIAINFYKFLNKITGLDMNNSSDFKLMKRQVVDSIREFSERNQFFRGVVDWVGYKTVKFPFEVDERHGGESHFSTFRLIRLALNAIFSYTSQPLYFTIISGGIFLLFALILGIETLYNYMSGYALDGFSTVILLVLITGSMLMLSMGVVGIYVSRIYDEVKMRPRYIIQKETINK